MQFIIYYVFIPNILTRIVLAAEIVALCPVKWWLWMISNVHNHTSLFLLQMRLPL